MQRLLFRTTLAVAAAMLAGFFSAPARAQPSVYDWTGFYAGVHGGGAWGKADGSSNAPSFIIPDITSQNLSGEFGGAQLGYQWQLGRTVWGVELSGSLAGIDTNSNCFPNSAGALGPGDSVNCKTKQDWNLQFLSRLGYAIGDGRFLPYATGGFALSRVNASKTVDVGGSNESWGGRYNEFGLGFGGGFQYALGNGYWMSAEYLYFSFLNHDNSTVVFPGCGCGAAAINGTQGLSVQSVRMSLNYTFGSPPPIAPDHVSASNTATSAYDWTGFYIGGQGGFNRSKLSGSAYAPVMPAGGALPLFIDKISQSADGGFGGAQFGYNYQLGRVVLGAEFSGTWNQLQADNICFPTVTPSFGDTLSCSIKQKWSAQFLGRFGYALDDGRLLPYIVGGIAISRTNLRYSEIDGPDAYEWGANKYMVGGVFGTGLQYAFGNGYSIGVEYLYTRYGTQDFSSLTSIAGFTEPPSVSTSSMSNQSIRFVANYSFGNPALNNRQSGSVYNWNGFYIGAHLGNEWGNTTGSDQAVFITSLNQPLSDLTKQNFQGQFGGAQIGYNRQYGRFVFGTEFSLSYGNTGGTKNCYENTSILAAGIDFSCKLEQSWTGQYLNRLGITSDDGRWLAYLSGGAALTKMNAQRSYVDSPDFDQWGDSQVHLGGVIGFGFQYALQNNFSIGMEYLHTQYTAQQYTSNSINFGAPSVFTQDLKTDSVRLVLNYKFDSGGSH